MIIIFTVQFDYSSSNVIKWLNFFGEKVVRINTDVDDFRFIQITKDGYFFRNNKTLEIINLKEAKACWWRKGRLSKTIFGKTLKKKFYVDDTDLTSVMSHSFENEASAILYYLKYTLSSKCKIQIGSPFLGDLNRLATIDLAQKHGLSVPQYQIITNLNQLTKRRDEEKIVTKAISDGIYDIISQKRFITYTEVLDEENKLSSNDVNVFPSIIMNLIEKEIEIRSFYLDGVFYSMGIFSQSSKQTEVDFRKYNLIIPNREEPYLLPKHIEKKLHNIFTDMRLNSGSVDLIKDKKGNYVFLEINPSGQYDMVSRPCNYHLDYTIAKYLIHGKTETN